MWLAKLVKYRRWTTDPPFFSTDKDLIYTDLHCFFKRLNKSKSITKDNRNQFSNNTVNNNNNNNNNNNKYILISVKQ